MPYAKKEDRRSYERAYRKAYRLNGRDKFASRRWREKRQRDWFNSTPGDCTYCGKRLTWDTAERDHIRPLTRGGTDTPENIAIACRRCNVVKGDRTPEEWNDAANGIGNTNP